MFLRPWYRISKNNADITARYSEPAAVMGLDLRRYARNASGRASSDKCNRMVLVLVRLEVRESALKAAHSMGNTRFTGYLWSLRVTIREPDP